MLAIVAAAGGEPANRQETIRVALQREGNSLLLEGIGLLAADENGVAIHDSNAFYLARKDDGISVNGKPVHMLTVTAPAYIKVNGRKFRGSIEIHPADNGMMVINELPLEDYLAGLINCEISSQWPMEAVKAQAVVARSYAIYQKEARKTALYHLESSVMDQVYNGCDIEDSRALRGVRETSGEVLTYNNTVIQAFYHSNCGGHTESSENVWGYGLPYLKGVTCSYCLAAPSAKWELTLPLVRLESLLKGKGVQINGLREVKITKRNRSGRISELLLIAENGQQTISAVELRKAVGFSLLKSTNFDVKVTARDVQFKGIGYGHGVGLCQWGAKHRAAEGFNYREILTYYYPGTKLVRLYNE